MFKTWKKLTDVNIKLFLRDKETSISDHIMQAEFIKKESVDTNDIILPFNMYPTYKDKSVGESNILSLKDLGTEMVEPITTQSELDEIITTVEEHKQEEAVPTVLKNKPLVKKVKSKEICTKRPLIAMSKRIKTNRKKVTKQKTITKMESDSDVQKEQTRKSESLIRTHSFKTSKHKIPTNVIIDKSFERNSDITSSICTSDMSAPVQPINASPIRSPAQQRENSETPEKISVTSTNINKPRIESRERLSEEYFNPKPFTNKIEVITSISREMKPSKPKEKTQLRRSTNPDFYIESKTIVSETRNEYDGASFEICMISIKVDHTSYKNLTKFDSDPHIYLTWELLGVEKRTRPITPLRKVDFKNCVVYYGLISKPILQHAVDHCIKVACYILKEDGTDIFIADGQLELSSTLANPGVMVYRYINLIGNGVEIELYCSFRLSNSNQPRSSFVYSEIPVKGKQEFPSSMKKISKVYTFPSNYVSDNSKEEYVYEEPCNICDKKEKHKHRLSTQQDEDDENNLIVKIETLKLSKNLLEDRNISQLYVECLFLGLRGQEMETKCLPKDHIMSFHYSKDFTHGVKTNKTVRHKLRKMLKPESQQVLRFLIVSEPLSKDQDIKECVEVGFAEVNLYTSMLLKKTNIVKEKLPVFTMDGKLKCGALVVSVLGIELMIDIMKGSGSIL